MQMIAKSWEHKSNLQLCFLYLMSVSVTCISITAMTSIGMLLKSQVQEKETVKTVRPGEL